MISLLAAVVCCLMATAVDLVSAASAKKQPPPNFLLILLDDMDVMLNSSHRAYLPRTWDLIADQGTVFDNMVVSMAWCCPSRVSLLTGKLVHNSNITSSNLPNGTGYGTWVL